jgi:hypothetical protein
MDSQVPPAPQAPTDTKPFPRQARSRARAIAQDAAWLRESGSFFDEAADDESWGQIDPKAYRLLKEIFGPSPDGVRVSAFVAMWFAARFTRRFAGVWSLPVNKPEIPELHELPSDARKMLPKVKRLLKHARAGELVVGGRRVSKQRVRRYSDLAKLLEKCIADRPQKRSRRSDEWHARARLYAKMIEDACHMAGVAPPTRNSTKSPLVTAVHGLLRLEGLVRTPDAVRKILGKTRR